MQKLLNAVLNHADCSQSGLLTLVLTLLAVNKILLSPYYYGPGLDGKEKVLNNFQVLLFFALSSHTVVQVDNVRELCTMHYAPTNELAKGPKQHQGIRQNKMGCCLV